MQAAVRLIGDPEMIARVKEILSGNGVTVTPVSVRKPGKDLDAVIEVEM